MNKSISQVISDQNIQKKIYLIRGKKVMLDRDLAALYGVTTKRLNEQVKRNLKRFPTDFMFQLNKPELEILRSQFATSSWGGQRHTPYAFSEFGVAMLSSVLNSDKAVQVNIKIIRVFIELRDMLSNEDLRKRIELLEKKYHEVGHSVQSVFQAFEEIKRMLEPPKEKKKKIGFL